jgi:ubiquinone/menaquinone biosynthesis C-methylase UbiE
MKTTDYSKIADRYDANLLRHEIPKDEVIGKLRAGAAKAARLKVLDLACGTGNYLAKQIADYGIRGIAWIGVDKSPEMLERAKAKNLTATLLEGDAAAIPLQDESVDYVKIRFAFHHFADKPQALREVHRVLKPGGAVSIYNLCHDYMRHSWVYRYFPRTAGYDLERFPTTLQLYRWLEELGFEPTIEIKTVLRKFRYDDIIQEVQNRDMSQLNLISDEEWEAGLAALRRDAAAKDYLVADIAFLDCVAAKPR